MKPGKIDDFKNEWRNWMKYNIWTDWRLWVSTLIFIVYSCLKVWYVIIFAPKVLEWIYVTPLWQPEDHGNVLYPTPADEEDLDEWAEDGFF